ncbi:MAG: hypothetical protein OXQ84_04880 [bacterium]|nr:hypothetical protein [bacterium]
MRKKDPCNDAFFSTYPSYKDFIQDPDIPPVEVLTRQDVARIIRYVR